jgi:hypothetical protein
MTPINAQYKITGLTALGGALEFYDFTIYALFAPYISQHFFRGPIQVLEFSIHLWCLHWVISLDN